MSGYDEDIFGSSSKPAFDPSIFAPAPKTVAPVEAKPSLVEDPGFGMTALIGAGRASDQMVKGVQQLYYKATGNEPALKSLADQVQGDNAAYAPLAKARPWATGLGESVPSALALVSGGGGPLAMAAKSAIAGAAPEAIKYGDAGERAGRALVGGAGGLAGAGIGLGISKILKPAATAASVGDDALNAAARIGYKPTAGQATQNPALLNIENYLARSPGSSGVMQQASQANQTALNRAAAGAMGESASDLSEGTFKAAQNRIGGEFSRLSNNTNPVLGNDFLNTLAKIDTANAAKGPFANKSISGLVDKGLDLAANGNLSGQAYKEVRTELGNAAQSAFKSGDASAGKAYKEMVASLDKAAKDGLSKADQEAWDTARKQWSAFKTLTKGNVAEAGDVSAARVASAVRRNGAGLRTGDAQGALPDIARIGEAFKGPLNPNSGNLMQTMLYGNPFTGVPLAAANRLGSGVYMSAPAQSYLRNGLLDVGPTGQRLLMGGGGLLGAPLGRGLLGVE